MTETLIIALVIMSFAIKDGLHNRGKEKPVLIWRFNLWIELSKLMRAVPIGFIIYLMGFEWRIVWLSLIMSYVIFMPTYNISAGRKLLYLGTGLYDTIIKVVIQNIWMYLASIAAAVVIWWNLRSKKLK